ncbi:hypothetical protein EPD60_16720 [Flaviaesturariibacter flavus]|uniref:T9SS type A sorting domain-containing protein n=1 Tax=Flaviaesturariibacter flavus TaxID=2502780 RepID=A0A4R1B6B4_9BACT|nr:hypothetical protein [Flaviaesturariibacter flavus]TCJ12187.1 hypothetical protein EPD60_16720 [Flaviaesturariibacter flavus]
MRRFLLLLGLSGLSLLAKSQVFLQPQLPASGLVMKNQLWNFIISNAGTQEREAQVEVLVSDARDNRRLFSGTSSRIVIRRGALNFRSGDLLPITYAVFDPNAGITTDQSGYLPAGAYTVCYSVLAKGINGMETLSENCENVAVEALNGPVLQLPEDNAGLEQENPLFSWIPPGPPNIFPSLSFDFKLVRVEATQSGADAISRNFPVFELSDVKTSQLQYPQSAPKLDSASVYAWQVIAKNGGKSIVASEVWTFHFSLKGTTPSGAERGVYSRRLSREEPLSAEPTGSPLRFVYPNEQNQRVIHLSFVDVSKSSSGSVFKDVYVKPGDNFLSVDILDLLQEGHTYLLSISDADNRKWFLKFTYRIK